MRHNLTAQRSFQEFISRVFGKEQVTEAEPTLGAEDFAYYGQAIPATFIFLGIYNETVNSVYGLHTPELRIDESVLHKGAALHASLAIDYLSSSAVKTEL